MYDKKSLFPNYNLNFRLFFLLSQVFGEYLIFFLIFRKMVSYEEVSKDIAMR
jgi:hypothetical protein